MTEQKDTTPKEATMGEIDIMEYVARLWKKRSIIIKWCCVGAVIGLIVGFSLPKTYKASTTLAPEAESMGSNTGGIAEMMGVSLGSSADAISVEMFPDVAHSTPFIVGLFDIPVQFERKDSVINTTLLDYMLEYQRKPWWNPIVKAPMKALEWGISLFKEKEVEQGIQSADSRDLAKLTKKERRVVEYFAQNILVSVDKKTGKTTIELEMQDPLVVYTVVQTVMEHLQDYVSDYRTSKVRQDIANLSVIYAQRKAEYYDAQQAYARYIDANKNVVLQSAQAERERLQQEMSLAYHIYSQIATQLETARIKEQEKKPVFVVLEPAAIPNTKAAPSKAKLLVIFTFLAGCLASVWVLFGNDIRTMIQEMSEEN